jgi:hypothetical protein
MISFYIGDLNLQVSGSEPSSRYVADPHDSFLGFPNWVTVSNVTTLLSSSNLRWAAEHLSIGELCPGLQEQMHADMARPWGSEDYLFMYL